MTVAPEIPEPIAVHEVRAADGYSIVLRRHGNPNGPRLVVSHGNGLSVDAYWPFWSRFTDAFDVIVHDLRSHGWNTVGHLDSHSIPTLAEDFAYVSHDIDRHFGARPKVGVFHSLSALTILHSRVSDEYSLLVLFDPPMRLPGRAMDELEMLGSRMGAATRRRRDRFDTPGAYAEILAQKPAFGGLDAATIDLLARTTLRPGADGRGYELACPREHEARLWDSLYPFARMTDFDAITCPIKVIGSDPTTTNSFLPSTEMPALTHLDYDFVPDTTHLLQLENPQACAAYTLEHLANGDSDGA